MRFVELAAVSENVAATAKRGEKTSLLAALLRSMTAEEAAVSVGLLTGQPRQGRIGVGWSALSKLDVADADEPSLEVLEVDRWLSDLAAQAGPGSTGRRNELLKAVFARATAPEQRLLWGVFSGELRQGALDGVMVDAVARGAGIPVDEVRRAHMFSGDLGETARQALHRRRRGPAHRHPRAGPRRRSDARRPGGGGRRGARRDGHGVGRMEARRRPRAGPPPRWRRPPVHPQPQRHHRPAAGCRVPRGRAVRGRPGARRRGRRGHRRRRAATVPGHDGRLQRPGGSGTRRWAGGLLLRRHPRRPARRWSTSRCRLAGACSTIWCRLRFACRRS